VDRNAGDARAVPVLSARLDSVACRTASAARLSRSAKPPGHADCVHRGKGVLGVWPLKLARDAVLAEQPAPAACQKFHDLVFRRHGTVLVGTSPANVAAGAAADQGESMPSGRPPDTVGPLGGQRRGPRVAAIPPDPSCVAHRPRSRRAGRGWPRVCVHRAHAVASAPAGCARGVLAEPGRACASTVPAPSPTLPPAALAASWPSLAVHVRPRCPRHRQHAHRLRSQRPGRAWPRVCVHRARAVARAPTGCARDVLAEPGRAYASIVPAPASARPPAALAASWWSVAVRVRPPCPHRLPARPPDSLAVSWPSLAVRMRPPCPHCSPACPPAALATSWPSVAVRVRPPCPRPRRCANWPCWRAWRRSPLCAVRAGQVLDALAGSE
jgi:hypothetical protein